MIQFLYKYSVNVGDEQNCHFFLFAMTNLVQRSSHSRLSYESQCSRGTPTLKHAWALLSTVGTARANDVILVNGPAIWGSASF